MVCNRDSAVINLDEGQIIPLTQRTVYLLCLDLVVQTYFVWISMFLIFYVCALFLSQFLSNRLQNLTQCSLCMKDYCYDFSKNCSSGSIQGFLDH